MIFTCWPGPDVFHLGLLVICRDPDVVECDHGHERLARLDLVPDLHRLFRDIAVDRRVDLRVL